MADIHCTVVTPEQTALEETASFVVLTLFDGEIGIGADHTPLIGRLGFGEMRLTVGDRVDRYFVEGGFVQVADNEVSILTSRTFAASYLDVQEAREQLSEARGRPADSPELMDIRDRAVTQARARLMVAQRAE